MSDALDINIDVFVINPRYRLQWEEAQGCHVLLYPEGLVKLSVTAAEILGRCQQPVNSQQLIAGLQTTYPDADSLPQDVMEFLAQARDQEWITRSGE